MKVLQESQRKKWDAETESQQLPPRNLWEGLSPEERLKKTRGWQHRRQILGYYEIQPYNTPPNTEFDVALDNDNAAEDQEVLDDLEYEDQGEAEQGKIKKIETGHGNDGQEEAIAGASTAQGETPSLGGDEPPVTYFTHEAEYY